MKFRILILLLFFVPGSLYAYNKPGCGNKDKDKNKNKVHCKGEQGTNSMESFVFVLPAANNGKNCKAKKDFHAAVVNFYKWYLQNEDKIATGLSKEDRRKDLIPPFNISWQTLHEYFEVIQDKYAEWVSNLSTEPAAYISPAAVKDASTKTPGGATGSTPDNSSTLNFSNQAK